MGKSILKYIKKKNNFSFFLFLKENQPIMMNVNYEEVRVSNIHLLNKRELQIVVLSASA